MFATSLELNKTSRRSALNTKLYTWNGKPQKVLLKIRISQILEKSFFNEETFLMVIIISYEFGKEFVTHQTIFKRMDEKQQRNQ